MKYHIGPEAYLEGTPEEINEMLEYMVKSTEDQKRKWAELALKYKMDEKNEEK